MKLITKEAGLKMLRDKIKSEFGSQIKYAESENVTPAYVSAILCGKRSAPAHMLRMIGAKQVKAFQIEEE